MLIRPDTLLGRVTRRLALLACACAALSLLACTAPKTATPRSFDTPEDAVKALIDAAKAETPDDLLAIFGPGRTGTGRRIRSGNRAPQSPCVHGRDRRGLATRRSNATQQGAHRRQRRLAVSGSTREKRGRLAIRYRGGKRGSARPSHWPQRARGDSRLPHLRHRAAALRAGWTRRQTRRRLRRHVPERFGPQNGLYWPPRTIRSAVRSVTWWPQAARKAASRFRIRNR